MEDRESPLVTLSSPFDGAVFKLDQTVLASYSCSDEQGGSGLVSCVGDVPSGAPIDTSSVGPQTFEVHATDGAGNVAGASATYRVLFDFERAPGEQAPPVLGRAERAAYA